MENAGIWKYFDYSLIGDEIVRMKPDPYAAEEVGKHFGVKPVVGFTFYTFDVLISREI